MWMVMYSDWNNGWETSKSLLSWRWEQILPPKHLQPPTTLHDFRVQKITVWTLMAVKTSYEAVVMFQSIMPSSAWGNQEKSSDSLRLELGTFRSHTLRIDFSLLQWWVRKRHYPNGGGSKHLWPIRKFLWDYRAQHPIRWPSLRYSWDYRIRYVFQVNKN
jgi:hypothetical protein